MDSLYGFALLWVQLINVKGHVRRGTRLGAGQKNGRGKCHETASGAMGFFRFFWGAEAPL